MAAVNCLKKLLLGTSDYRPPSADRLVYRTSLCPCAAVKADGLPALMRSDSVAAMASGLQASPRNVCDRNIDGFTRSLAGA